MIRVMITVLVVLLGIVTTGCSFGGSDPCKDVSCSGAGTCVVLEDQASCNCNLGYHADGLSCMADPLIGTPTILKTALEGSPHHENYINFRQMNVEAEPGDFDLRLFEDANLGGMALSLGSGVSAVNLGSTVLYHSVTQAPADGYATDVGQSYAIGPSFHSGGGCEMGYQMSKNIYVLKLADGTYAKIEMLSAKKGVVEVLGFRQSDGSTSLKTKAP